MAANFKCLLVRAGMATEKTFHGYSQLSNKNTFVQGSTIVNTGGGILLPTIHNQKNLSLCDGRWLLIT